MLPSAARTLPVTVVIPAFNAAGTLASAIRSARRQTPAPAEIIVVDDGSRDRTADVAFSAGARVIRLPFNAGPAAARNIGVAASAQPWIAFLDADDVWLEDKLAAQWDALQRWPQAGFCFTDSSAVFPNGHAVSHELRREPDYRGIRTSGRAGDAFLCDAESCARALIGSFFIRQSSVVVSKALFQRCSGYRRDLRLAEDCDLFLRLLAHSPAIAIERPLIRYQPQVNSLSGDALAQIRALDVLWSAILCLPDDYPPAAVARIRSRRHAILRKGCLLALRLTRFSEARTFAQRALLRDRSPLAFALRALVGVCASPAGTAVLRFSRKVWRTRAARGRPALRLSTR